MLGLFALLLPVVGLLPQPINIGVLGLGGLFMQGQPEPINLDSQPLVLLIEPVQLESELAVLPGGQLELELEVFGPAQSDAGPAQLILQHVHVILQSVDLPDVEVGVVASRRFVADAPNLGRH